MASRLKALNTGIVGTPGASVTVYLTGTTTLASLYSDPAGQVPATNPQVTDQNGRIHVFLPDGIYDLVITGLPNPITVSVIDHFSKYIYVGSGAPGASTLSPQWNYNAGEIYYDSTGGVQYVCSTGGSNSTSVWKVSGGVTSVTAADGTLIVSPTSGTVTARANTTSAVSGVKLEAWYTGAGAPGAGTLAAGTYNVGDRYWDSTNNHDYVCQTSGSASTSVWKQIDGGGGTTIVLDNQAPLNVQNTNAETTLYSYTVGASVLGGTQTLHTIIAGDETNDGNVASLALTYKFYIGTTQLFSYVTPAFGNAEHHGVLIDIFIRLNGSQNASANTNLFMSIRRTSTTARSGGGGNTVLDSNGILISGESVDDTFNWTTAQTIKLTCQPSGASANSGFSRGQGTTLLL